MICIGVIPSLKCQSLRSYSILKITCIKANFVLNLHELLLSPYAKVGLHCGQAGPLLASMHLRTILTTEGH